MDTNIGRDSGRLRNISAVISLGSIVGRLSGSGRSLMPRRRRVLRQGDLDGLCGIYSVVNALRYLLQLNKAQSQELFERLVKALVQDSRRPHKLLVEGILFNRLKQLVAAAGRCRLADRDLSFQVRTLRLRRDEQTLANLWAVLDQEVGPACVAIIGVTGADDHWCVVHRVTPKTLRLLDSSGRSCIRRSRCTVRSARTRYCLELSEILLLER